MLEGDTGLLLIALVAVLIMALDSIYHNWKGY